MSDEAERAAAGEASRDRSRRQALITSRERVWLVVILVWFMLIAAAITAPLALASFRGPRERIPTDIILQGDAAAKQAWPARTPHDEPWPAPTQWQGTRRWGFRHYQAWSASATPGVNGFQLEVHRYGFPLPIAEQVQYWWDWKDPKLTGPESSPALRLLWPGLILNPLIVGAGAYLILMAPVVTFILGKRLARRAADRCLYCGYPRGESPVCTECGRPL